jgi:hypothetical protein
MHYLVRNRRSDPGSSPGRRRLLMQTLLTGVLYRGLTLEFAKARIVDTVRGRERPWSGVSTRSTRARRIEREHDATRQLAHRFREHGRFGSHVSHDGFGDSDRP